MKSQFRLKDGSKLAVTTIHPAGAVCVEKFLPSGQLLASFHIPADLCGVFAQAVELSGKMVESGPCARPQNLPGFTWPELQPSATSVHAVLESRRKNNASGQDGPDVDKIAAAALADAQKFAAGMPEVAS